MVGEQWSFKTIVVKLKENNVILTIALTRELYFIN